MLMNSDFDKAEFQDKSNVLILPEISRKINEYNKKFSYLTNHFPRAPHWFN